MPATTSTGLKQLSEWLEENTFWNSEALNVQESAVGGLGVFMKPQAELEDNLLLRVPKQSVLSPKNSFIYSLVVDYESSNPAIDLTSGMHALVLAYIYEQSAGPQSPWHSYLSSFSLDEDSVPICLWKEEEKKALFNTECDLLNMLDVAELVSFYMECVAFASYAQDVVAKPGVLEYTSEGDKLEAKSPAAAALSGQLVKFGRCVQAVISRAFTVDKHLGLSLVPGADLFNHLSPLATESGIQSRENVHFICDDDDDLCEQCGESGCAHLESEDEAEGDEDEEVENDDGEENDEGSENFEEEEDDEDLTHLVEGSEVEMSQSDTENETEASESNSDAESDAGSDAECPETEMTEISMKDIEQLEMEDDSEADTDREDEEVSTVSLSEDEEEMRDNESMSSEPESKSAALQEHNDRMELAKELADGSKCCDIVLTRPSQGELFNTYGEDLANAYLLQRYGFISEQNPNDSCLLSVQMFTYLKSDKAKKQQEVKLDWYDGVFELVNELVGSGHGEECTEPCCGEQNGEIEESRVFFDRKKAADAPESWQLSPKVLYNGQPTVQTLALLRLLQMPFKVFLARMYRSTSQRKMEKRIQRYLLEGTMTRDEKRVLLSWVKMRLQRYSTNQVPDTPRGATIQKLVANEKSILSRAVVVLSE